MTTRLFCRALAVFAGAVTVLLSTGLSASAQVQTNSDGSIDLPYVPPESVPMSGTFWMLSGYGQFGASTFGAPLPLNPFGTNVNVYSYASNEFGWSFVVDDREVDYQALESEQSQNSMESLSLDSEEGGGSYGPLGFEDCTNCLWLEITAIDHTNDWAAVTLHGTLPGI